MTSLDRTARQAGLIYFLFMIIAIVDQFFVPRVLVAGDPARTAANLASGELTYRLAIVLGLATHVIFLFLVVMLHKLFKGVDETLALMMVVLVSVGVAVALTVMTSRFLPLLLLNGDAYHSALGRPQLEVLAQDAMRFRNAGATVAMAFWGLWLFPFGLLVMKSGFIPRILGVLLLVAGSAYLIGSVAAIAFPEQRAMLSRVLMPLYLGEVPIIFWLMIKGVRQAQPV